MRSLYKALASAGMLALSVAAGFGFRAIIKKHKNHDEENRDNPQTQDDILDDTNDVETQENSENDQGLDDTNDVEPQENPENDQGLDDTNDAVPQKENAPLPPTRDASHDEN